MNVTLADIAAPRAGYTFRSGVQNDAEGDVMVIQGRDVNAEACSITPSGDAPLTRVRGGGIRQLSEHLLHPGDVLLMARGSRNYAAVVNEDLPAPAIAVSSFHVLCPDSSKVDPAFLAWLLNQDSTQAYLRANNTGTTIPMINLESLRLLPLKLPPLHAQASISEVIRLAAEERSLMQQIAEQRQQLLRAWAAQNL